MPLRRVSLILTVDDMRLFFMSMTFLTGILLMELLVCSAAAASVGVDTTDESIGAKAVLGVTGRGAAEGGARVLEGGGGAVRVALLHASGSLTRPVTVSTTCPSRSVRS